MSDEATSAERLALVLFPDPDAPNGYGVRIAQRAIAAGWMDKALALERGWTPPPDPHEDIARELYASLPLTMQDWNPQHHAQQADLLAAVRRMDLRRGNQ